MNIIEEIKAAVQKFSREELAVFRDWFYELDWDAWDRQFEEDVAAGRLDRLAEEAIADHAAGRCTDR